MDIQKEREAFECEFKQTDYYIAHGDPSTLMLCDDQYALDDVQVSFEMWKAAKAQAVPNLRDLQERIGGHQYYHDEYGHMIVDMDDVVKEISGFDGWKAQAVPEESKRQGGYYIRDLRNQPGNCMKFWYQGGYGTKHKNFFWCETLEQAKKYQGRCGWFEIWHAPYIDSLIEHTVDFQLADRSIGFVDLEAQEQK